MPVVGGEKLPELESGRVRITCDDPHLILEGYLGPDSPSLTGGFGGWNITGRPRQVGMTTWDGIDPFELTFQLLWDGIVGPVRQTVREFQHSVEPALRDLMTVVRGDKESDPGIVDVDGIPSLPTKRWVITNVDFGDAIRRVSDMHRVRLLLTFTLLEYIAPHFEPLGRKAVGKDKGKTVVINAKDKDTPQKIAGRRHVKWTVIRALNPGIVKSANQKLKKGTKLRVPAKKPTRNPR